MQKITSTAELRDAIRELEYRQSAEWESLREYFVIIRDRFSPGHLIRNKFVELFTVPNLIKTVLSTSIGLTAGYFTKKYFKGYSGSLLKKILDAIF